MADTGGSQVCVNLVGIISGSILGTLAVCTIITGIVIYFICRKHRQKKIKYLESSQRPAERNFSSIESSLETGLHNSGYVSDVTDSNDLFMMMDTRRKVSVENNRSNTLDEAVSTSFQNLDCIEVNLVGKDVSGLGFDVKGNPRDGISVSNIHERGAAKESRKIKVGDKVLSLTISFDNMVYEDALTLLSYASPYPIKLVLGKKKPNQGKENTKKRSRVVQNGEGDESSVSTISKSHDLSDSQSESVHASTGEEDSSDDDTKKRAPAHLPQNIKSLVESKKSGKQAVEVIEEESKKQILSPLNLQSDVQLSYGAQSALDMILNKHTAHISTES